MTRLEDPTARVVGIGAWMREHGKVAPLVGLRVAFGREYSDAELRAAIAELVRLGVVAKVGRDRWQATEGAP